LRRHNARTLTLTAGCRGRRSRHWARYTGFNRIALPRATIRRLGILGLSFACNHRWVGADSIIFA
jgi:hypothetical protein